MVPACFADSRMCAGARVYACLRGLSARAPIAPSTPQRQHGHEAGRSPSRNDARARAAAAPFATAASAAQDKEVFADLERRLMQANMERERVRWLDFPSACCCLLTPNLVCCFDSCKLSSTVWVPALDVQSRRVGRRQRWNSSLRQRPAPRVSSACAFERWGKRSSSCRPGLVMCARKFI